MKGWAKRETDGIKTEQEHRATTDVVATKEECVLSILLYIRVLAYILEPTGMIPNSISTKSSAYCIDCTGKFRLNCKKRTHLRY